jgi:hypothetical protein
LWGSAYPEEYQKAAEAAVSMFNGVIQREAAGMGYTVMELRELFTDKEDYANPIEPSAQGGDKIAEALAEWTGGVS